MPENSSLDPTQQRPWYWTRQGVSLQAVEERFNELLELPGPGSSITADPSNPGLYASPGVAEPGRLVSVDANTKLPSPAVQAAWVDEFIEPAAEASSVAAAASKLDITALPPGINNHFGWAIHTGARTKAGVIATLDAAEAMGKGTIAYFPAGANYDVETGLSLSGYSCQIRGAGAAMLNSTTPAGTVFHATSQSGPVLDFKGWLSPTDFSGKVRHGDFFVRGSGTADATKANVGLRVDSCQSTTFSDIAIMDTGGAGLRITADVPGYACYLCDFERFTIRTPVGAVANDVPYMHSIEANGNRFRGFGFISRTAGADAGVSGAIVLEGSASYPSHDNKLDAFWFEFLHLSTNGCLVSVSGNGNIISDTQFFDSGRVSGATGTAYYRMLPSTVTDFGGNEIRGVIPGDNNGAATSIGVGVDVQQSGNAVVGTKGYRGNNVLIASGVNRTHVHLRGAYSNSNTLGWTNSSGTTTNHLIDAVSQIEIRPSVWAIAGPATYFVLGSRGTDFSFDALSGARSAMQVTLTANISLTAISNPVAGATYTFVIQQDATGSRTLGWPANIRWAGNSAPTLSTTAHRKDVFVFFYDSFNSTFREVSRSLNQT
jgi:hypothetical protein